jgi:hypothetical protein
MKQQKKERAITAQPLGDAFSVPTGNSLKPLEPRNEAGYQQGPSGTLQYGDGCYRRVPRFFDE